MYFSSFGGNYLKAQMQNNTAKARCELYQRQIAKKHIHSLATINKNIRDMEDFLKDIKANSGYWKDLQEFSSLSQSKFAQVAPKTAPGDAGNADLNKRRLGCMSSDNKTPALSEPQVLKSEISDLDEGARMVTEAKFGADQVHEVVQLCDGKNEQDFVNEAGSSFPAKNAIRTGKGSGHERGRRSHERNTKAAQWLGRDENLIGTDRRDSSSIAKNSEPAENEHNSDDTQVVEKETKLQRSRSCLQAGKNVLNDDQDAQNPKTQLQGKSDRETNQPAEPQQAWTDRPPKNRDIPTSLSKGAGAAPRSQTAPAKASRLKTQVKSASASEGQSTAKHQSSTERKKLKVYVSLSKSERRQILQELIYNSTVTPDRSFLERERQALLKDKISKFFESLSEQVDAELGTDEEDIFRDDEDLQKKVTWG